MKIIYKAIVILTGIYLPFMGLRAQDKPGSKNIGEPAPELYVSKWIKGGKVDGFQKGKTYVVEFWATWCGPCIAGMPHLSSLAHQYKDVTVMGISILERKGTDLPMVEKFVAGKGDKMDYHVGAEQGNLMANNWLHAFGAKGIPTAFVVNKDGVVAWLGHPNDLDKILPQIISGNWDLAKAAVDYKENLELWHIDNWDVVLALNKKTGKEHDYKGTLAFIDSIVARYPKLKYAPMTGHFTFYALLYTNPEKALEFGRKWMLSDNEPRYESITYFIESQDGLPPALYVLAADAYQAQLDRYPWSMEFAATYKKMAQLYTRAGDTEKAAELQKKASEYVEPSK